MAHLLLIEDDERIVRAWTRVLARHGHTVQFATSLAAARGLIAAICMPTCLFDGVLLDLALPDGDGAALLADLASLRPRPPVAVVSAHIDCQRAINLWGRCVVAVPKPLGIVDLLQLVGRLVREGAPGEALDGFCVRHQLPSCERRLLRAAADGLSSKQLGVLLDLSPASVATYWARMLKKTGCHSRAELVAVATRACDRGHGRLGP